MPPRGMSSTVSFTNNYVLLAGTNDFVSRPYEVSEILAGFNECAPAKAVKSIRKIQLGFSVDLRVNGVERGYHQPKLNGPKFRLIGSKL